MAWKQKNPGAYLARRATRRASLRSRDPHRFKKMVWGLVGTVVIIIAALAWGGYLKAESDARRAAEEADEWLVDQNIAVSIPVFVPEINAGYAAPSGKMSTDQEMRYGGVTLDLGSCLSPLPYDVSLPETSGLTVSPGAPALKDEVKRFKNAGFYVIGVFTVTSFDSSDITERTLLKGLEMTLLSLFSKAGVDNILLLGLPAGNDQLDAATVAYLQDAEKLLASVPTTVPSLGVALRSGAFIGEVRDDGSLVYAGSMTPGRMLSVCDYIALDLRGMGAAAQEFLKEMQYAYVRYQLRLLTSQSIPEEAEAALAHGFGRIFDYGK